LLDPARESLLVFHAFLYPISPEVRSGAKLAPLKKTRPEDPVRDRLVETNKNSACEKPSSSRGRGEGKNLSVISTRTGAFILEMQSNGKLKDRLKRVEKGQVRH